MRLGRRQLDVLRAADALDCSAWHTSQGRFVVSGVEDVHPMEVLESLFDHDLITHGHERGHNGYDVILTDAGRRALYPDE